MSTRSRRVDGEPETADDRRFFRAREAHPARPVDQNGHVVTSGPAADAVQALRDQATRRQA